MTKNKEFQEFHKCASYAMAIGGTQEEVFGNVERDYNTRKAFWRLMDFARGKSDPHIEPNHIFSVDEKSLPQCPICKRQILGFDLLLDYCDDSKLAGSVRANFAEKKEVPTQCPSGHFLFYDFVTNAFIKRQKSKIDETIAKARTLGYLPSIWKK